MDNTPTTALSDGTGTVRIPAVGSAALAIDTLRVVNSNVTFASYGINAGRCGAAPATL